MEMSILIAYYPIQTDVGLLRNTGRNEQQVLLLPRKSFVLFSTTQTRQTRLLSSRVRGDGLHAG